MFIVLKTQSLIYSGMICGGRSLIASQGTIHTIFRGCPSLGNRRAPMTRFLHSQVLFCWSLCQCQGNNILKDVSSFKKHSNLTSYLFTLCWVLEMCWIPWKPSWHGSQAPYWDRQKHSRVFAWWVSGLPLKTGVYFFLISLLSQFKIFCLYTLLRLLRKLHCLP